MITWMQKHKKWLIVTIWISTIAFVGAGFVGWGSYDYGKSSGTVATVNGNEIPMSDLQNEYSALYSQYQQMFGESFNKELAQQLKIEDAALQRVIQKNLLINYANELGLAVTDKEVAKELLKIQAFYKDGKFDKNTYMSLLKQNKKTAADFEEQVKQDLLVSKVQNIFANELLPNEIQNIGKLLYSQDKVSIMTIDSSKVKITPKESELKKYWEENKDQYKSEIGTKISYTKVANIDGKTKKEMKKVALKKYLDLKKGEDKFSVTKTIYPSSNFVIGEDYTNLIASEDGKISKPLYINEQYYVIKKISSILPQVLEYEQAKIDVRSDYMINTKQTILDKKTQDAIQNFKGKSIGYISRDFQETIGGLSQEQSAQVIQKIFASTSKIDSIDLGDKIVVFNITDTKLGDYDNKNDETVKTVIGNVKNTTASNGLLEQLKNKYEVKSFMGTN